MAADLDTLRQTVARIVARQTEIAAHLSVLADATVDAEEIDWLDRQRELEDAEQVAAMESSDHLAELLAVVSAYLETQQ